MQSTLLSSELNFPSGQSSHAVDALGADERWPAKQSLHSACPVAFWYLPASHASHPTLPSLSATLPAMQFSQALLPDSCWNCPRGHFVQSFVLLLADFLPKCPNLHCLQNERPFVSVNLPASQAVQALPPVIFWYLPAGQSAQVAFQAALIPMFLNCPVGHKIHLPGDVPLQSMRNCPSAQLEQFAHCPFSPGPIPVRFSNRPRSHTLYTHKPGWSSRHCCLV